MVRRPNIGTRRKTIRRPILTEACQSDVKVLHCYHHHPGTAHAHHKPPPETATLLSRLAKQEKKSVACLTKELVLDALERREDVALSLLADRREREQKGKKIYTHKQAWGG